MDLPSLQANVTLGILVLAPVTFASLLFYTAPYGGRHTTEGKLPSLPARPGWVLMELPAVFCFGYFFFSGAHPGSLPALAMFLLWQMHYLDRTFLYPLRTRGNARHSLMIVATAFCYQTANGFVNGYALSHARHLASDTWLTDPRFVVGSVLFLVGFFINRQSDHILRNLRKPGETGYKVPTGGLFGQVSCPNYLGEILIWSGFALASWTLAGLSFALYTIANLVPRALSHHRWYQEKFSDYPGRRKAVLPGLL